MCRRTSGELHLLDSVDRPADLVSRIRAGDKDAETEFVARYRRGLLLLLLKRSNGDLQVANDCVQETFLIALTRIRSGEIEKPKNIASFLRQTAVYVCVDYYRKQKRFTELGSEESMVQQQQPDQVLDGIQRFELRKMLQEILGILPTNRDREILERFYFLEEEKVDLCERFELSSAHFDRVIFRAKARVRSILKENHHIEAQLRAEMGGTEA
jgi:RNA polymerase sigma-70 factor (ECF subfamily)